MIEKFIQISLKDLRIDEDFRSFPFELFLLSMKSQKVISILPPNQPLDNIREEALVQALDKLGFILVIKYSQKLTFITFMGRNPIQIFEESFGSEAGLLASRLDIFHEDPDKHIGRFESVNKNPELLERIEQGEKIWGQGTFFDQMEEAKSSNQSWSEYNSPQDSSSISSHSSNKNGRSNLHEDHLEKAGPANIQGESQEQGFSLHQGSNQENDDEVILNRSQNVNAALDQVPSETPEQIAKNAEEGFRYFEDVDLNDVVPETLTYALLSENFLPLISFVRREIQKWPRTHSEGVSMAINLSALLDRDNTTNRIAVMTYMLCEEMDIVDLDTRSDLMVASLLHHIGYTQMDPLIIHGPINNHNSEQERLFKKHTGYTEHMISRIGLKLNDRIMDIIKDHHELEDGSGFPRQKILEKIEPLALILGISSHFFEYASGIYTGEPLSLKELMFTYYRRSKKPGLLYGFGPKLVSAFGILLMRRPILISELPDENNEETQEPTQIAA